MPDLAGQLDDGGLPGRGVRRESLANQPGLVLQRVRDLAFEISPERAFGDPEQDGDSQSQDEDRAQDQSPDKGHRARAPRSFPLKR